MSPETKAVFSMGQKCRQVRRSNLVDCAKHMVGEPNQTSSVFWMTLQGRVFRQLKEPLNGWYFLGMKYWLPSII